MKLYSLVLISHGSFFKIKMFFFMSQSQSLSRGQGLPYHWLFTSDDQILVQLLGCSRMLTSPGLWMVRKPPIAVYSWYIHQFSWSLSPILLHSLPTIKHRQLVVFTHLLVRTHRHVPTIKSLLTTTQQLHGQINQPLLHSHCILIYLSTIVKPTRIPPNSHLIYATNHQPLHKLPTNTNQYVTCCDCCA